MLPGEPLKPGPHKIQGIGAGFIPDVLNTEIIDEVDPGHGRGRRSRWRGGWPRRRACWCGISLRRGGRGPRSQVAQRPENAGKLIVVVLPDLGERYLSTPLFPDLAD